MKILVCLKQILDPDIPPRDFRIDPERLQADPRGGGMVTNIFCENALETALQFRDKVGGTITVLSLGTPSAEEALRKALAQKADQACLILSEPLTHPRPDQTARILAAAIGKLGPFDLIVAGRESGDWGNSQTGGLLAEQLGLPCVSFVDTIEPRGDGLLLRRQTDSGWERVETPIPVCVTITNNEFNVPRIPKIRDIMQSKRQTMTRWTLAELGLSDLAHSPPASEVVALSVPTKNVECQFAEGSTLEEKVESFARQLASAVQGG